MKLDFTIQTEPPEGYKTFKDWSSRGYFILKGSKAKWVNNVAYFSPDQVTKLNSVGFRKVSGLVRNGTCEKGEEREFREYESYCRNMNYVHDDPEDGSWLGFNARSKLSFSDFKEGKRIKVRSGYDII